MSDTDHICEILIAHLATDQRNSLALADWTYILKYLAKYKKSVK